MADRCEQILMLIFSGWRTSDVIARKLNIEHSAAKVSINHLFRSGQIVKKGSRESFGKPGRPFIIWAINPNNQMNSGVSNGKERQEAQEAKAI